MGAESLRARVMTGYALCAIAEGHIHAGELERALKTIQAVRKMIAEADALLSAPHPHTEVREVLDILPDLEKRIQKVEAALPPA